MKLPRVLFVTGKGGSGKSTIAAAFALALSRNRAITLADIDGRMDAATLLGVVPREDEPARSDDSLRAVVLSRRAELHSFIQRIVPVSAISQRMLRSRTFGYVTAALPGLEAFLLMERLRIMAGEAALEDRHIVIDAPASGTALELLAVAAGVKGIAPAGTLNRLAKGIESFLGDPSLFGAIITVTPEELALREAIDTAKALRESIGVEVFAAVLNRTVAPLFGDEDLEHLVKLGAHRRLAQKRADQRRAAIAAAKRLKAAGVALFELPTLFSAAMGTREVSALARELASGMAAK